MKDVYFNSIDELPIWNWWKVTETGNFIYLNTDSDYYEGEDYTELGYLTWIKLQDEYISFFGINEEFKKMMELRKKWIDKKTDFLLTGNRFRLTEIDIIESKLIEDADNNKKIDKDSTIILLEEKLGREIDERKISVKKYYNYIKHYTKS